MTKHLKIAWGAFLVLSTISCTPTLQGTKTPPGTTLEVGSMQVVAPSLPDVGFWHTQQNDWSGRAAGAYLPELVAVKAARVHMHGIPDQSDPRSYVFSVTEWELERNVNWSELKASIRSTLPSGANVADYTLSGRKCLRATVTDQNARSAQFQSVHLTLLLTKVICSAAESSNRTLLVEFSERNIQGRRMLTFGQHQAIIEQALRSR